MSMVLGALLLLMAAVAAMMTDNASLLLVALGSAMGTFWLLRDYRLLIMAYSILPTLAISLDIGFATPFIAVTPLVVLAALIHYRGRWSELRGPALYFAPLLLQIVFVVIAELATDATMNFGNIFSLTGGLVVALLINALLREPEDLRQIALTIAINLLILGASAALATDWSAVNVDQVRVSGLAGEPNILGMHVGRMMPVGVAVLLERGMARWQRVVALVATTLGFVAVTAAASRTGTIALTVGFVAMALLSARSAKSLGVALALLTAGALALMYLTPASFQTRVLEPAGLARGAVLDVNRVEVTSGRLEQLPIAFSMLERSPWIGHGTGGFVAENANRYAGTATALHNAYLSVVVAYGLPAGMAFVFAIGAAIWMGVRHVRRSPVPLISASIAAGAVATAIGLVAYPEAYRSWVWLPFILTHAFDRVNQRWFRQQRALQASQAPPAAPAAPVAPTPPRGAGHRPLLHVPASALAAPLASSPRQPAALQASALPPAQLPRR